MKHRLDRGGVLKGDPSFLAWEAAESSGLSWNLRLEENKVEWRNYVSFSVESQVPQGPIFYVVSWWQKHFENIWMKA